MLPKQFSILIHQIQLPEEEQASATTPANAGGGNTPPATAAPATTPDPSPPATLAVPTTPTFWEFAAQHLRTDPSARLWLGMFVFLALIVRVILSPMLSLIFVASTYSLIWAPQILRSVRRGRSSGLSKSYIVGTTVARLYIALCRFKPFPRHAQADKLSCRFPPLSR